MKKIPILFVFISFIAQGTDPYQRNPSIDIQHYTFQLEVNDSTDFIVAKAFIEILFKKSITDFELDLIKTLQIDSKRSIIDIKTDFEPIELVLDPCTWLLFEGTIQKK